MNPADKNFLQSHPLYIVWREKLRDEWHEVIIRQCLLIGAEESRWVCDNLEGYFSFRRFQDIISLSTDIDDGIIFIFELESDAMAFKIAWWS